MAKQQAEATGTDLVVARMEPICRALAEVRDAGEAKHVADLARAAEVYARRQKLGEEAERYAHAVLVDAMTLMGEFLKAGPKNRGANGSVFTGSKREPVKDPTPTLASLGIGKKSSANGQALVNLQQEAPALYAQVRRGDLTVSRARQEWARARDARDEKASGTPELPTKTYRTLVVDPPWPMKKSERSPRPEQGPALKYKTMSVEEIAALPVADLASPRGCHLYLWVTHRFLPDGLEILDRWGFTYHCVLTWVKPTGMTPFSWMFNTEHVLFAYQGKFVPDKQGLKVSFDAPAGKGNHSAKPGVFFERVRQFSKGPRLEMFEREPHEGFEGWGNESRRKEGSEMGE